MTESHAKKAQMGSLRYCQDLTKHAHTLFTPLPHNNDHNDMEGKQNSFISRVITNSSLWLGSAGETAFMRR